MNPGALAWHDQHDAWIADTIRRKRRRLLQSSGLQVRTRRRASVCIHRGVVWPRSPRPIGVRAGSHYVFSAAQSPRF